MNRWSMSYRLGYRKAFTLIELLVVVAIIGLLVAILLPSLKRARDSARGAACASNMHQCLKGIEMQRAEKAMSKQRVNTNFGWAVETLRQNTYETGIFTCPDDRKPRPIPALYVDVNGGAGGGRKGSCTTTPDGLYNRNKYVDGNIWRVDIQNSIEGTEFGVDANNADDKDLELEYKVIEGQKFADVSVSTYESAYTFAVRDHRGKMVWRRALANSPPFKAPLMWMSYGANAVAGLRTVKGNPVLLIEAGKPGIFPLPLGPYPAEDTPEKMAKGLRFRHGTIATPSANLTGYDYTAPGQYVTSNVVDVDYTPRRRQNAGFLDGHVQMMMHTELLRPDKGIWRGSGKGVFMQFSD